MANQLAPRMERRGGGGVNRLLGIIEPAMTVGSAIAAEVPALAVGLGSLNTVEDRQRPFSEAVSAADEVREMLTYNPRSMEGQAGMQSLINSVSQIADTVGLDRAFQVLNEEIIPRVQSTLGKDAARELGSMAMMIPAVRRLSGLPMDTASRMQRAKEMEFEKNVYHGTYSDFLEFDPQNDLGVHVGTPEQAYNRLLDLERHKIFNNSGTRGGITVGEGGQIMPLKAKLKKSLNMKDVGDWKNPYEVLVGLRATPIGKKYEKQLNEIEDEMIPEMESFRYGEENWTDSREASEYTDELRDIIRNEGYDSVKYLNEVENKYGSQSGLTPKGKKQKEKLQKEVKKINDEIGKRDQELVPKLGASAEEIEKFIETKPTTRTAEENKKIENLKLQIKEIEENETYDPHSYIILDPEQLRSINAEFDPEKKDSSNILSSILDQRFRNIA